MNSCLYTGHIRHRRYRPVTNGFRYRIFFVCLDLAELDEVFVGRWLWSVDRVNLAFLRRRDHFGDPALSIDESVRRLVEKRAGRRPEGSVRMVTHLRDFGYCFNPATFYYCYSGDGERLDYIVVEVHNTPWNESHCYVLDMAGGDEQGGLSTHRLSKEFHVSPFLPMDIDYRWQFSPPGDALMVRMEDYHQGELCFAAELELKRAAISGLTLANVLIAYPLMTMKVSLAIYWQALRLWIKGAVFHEHPSDPAPNRSKS